MKKELLVIGGSYFVGRVFNILASRTGSFNITVINRGRYELNLDGVSQTHFDRHDAEKIKELPAKDYDAVIDFCAYEPGDIALWLENLPGSVKQYIFISTSSVYEVGILPPVTEDSPLTTRFGTDENARYVQKKLILEDECKEACKNKAIAYTILRPTFIFGPFNYAPREPFYFTLLLDGKEIPVPTDAEAKFQFVYVKDIARALMGAIGNERVYDRIFNLAGPEVLDYQGFMKALEEAHGAPLKTRPVTVRDAAEQKIPLPFPLLYDELCDGGRITKAIDFAYTPFGEAFKETYDIFRKAYQK
ncbi:MAG: NAD-dependent epimerase/dehydratase family protein [Clostridiales bacterium]|jgi:nucleoside-diphosphate-sugar epimerase|nr:NAD-dependent epimerase/dehydratase family protein [Clostridiales bacterium]